MLRLTSSIPSAFYSILIKSRKSLKKRDNMGPRGRWKVILNLILRKQEVRYGLDLIFSGQGPYTGPCKSPKEHRISINGREIPISSVTIIFPRGNLNL
jgi:hypothetical protein